MTTAAHTWRKSAPWTRDSATLEISRQNAAISGWQHEIDTMDYRDDIPRYQMTGMQRFQIDCAQAEIKKARAFLENILKE